MKPLVIVGAGGHAREIHQIIFDINALTPTWQVSCFAVEPEYSAQPELIGIPVLAIEEASRRYPMAFFVIAVGSGALRERLAFQLGERPPEHFPVLAHPRSQVGCRVRLGHGCVVFPGSIITADVRLGSHVHLNVCSTVSHDCDIGDYVTLGPHAACCGGVVLEKHVELGAGSVVIPRVTVGARSVIGAGAVVIDDCPARVTAVGVPARRHLPSIDR